MRLSAKQEELNEVMFEMQMKHWQIIKWIDVAEKYGNKGDETTWQSFLDQVTENQEVFVELKNEAARLRKEYSEISNGE